MAKVKPIFKPSVDELKGAHNKFLYELKMFRITANAYATNSVPGDPAFKTAVLEAALIHARNLYDFFTGNESWEDNIIAGHFVKDPNGALWKSTQLAFLALRKGEINKALSHLTYTRVNSKPTWNIEPICQDIENAYSEFLALLSATERIDWQA